MGPPQLSALQLTVLVLAAATTAAASSPSRREAAFAKHLLALGWRNVTILVDDKEFSPNLNKLKLIKTLSDNDVQAAIVKIESMRKDPSLFGHVAKVVIMGESNSNLAFFKELLLRRDKPPYHTMIYESRLARPEEESNFEEEFKAFTMSAGFFRLQEMEDGELQLDRAQTFRDQDLVVQNKWVVDDEGKLVEQPWNLMGATITSLSGSWEPWLKQFDCEPVTEEVSIKCKASGILHVLMDILGKGYNFTVQWDDTAVWGVAPVKGKSSDPDAEWVGTLGGVFNDEYDSSISVWVHTRDREYFGDFTTSIYARPSRNTLNNLQPIVDITLFLRPFTVHSWISIIAFVVILVAFLVIPFWVFRKSISEDGYSSRIAVAFGWAFFLLINAYYGGALTMFLSTENTPPFESVREGILLYPEWKMIIVAGEELSIVKHTEAGDPIMSRYWEIMQENKEELIQPSFEAALEMLLEPGYFLYQSSPLLLTQNYIELNHPDLELDLQRVESYDTSAIILQNNSPIKRMLNEGLNAIRQTGMLDVIIRKAVRPLPKSFDGPQGEVLGGRQLGLVFFFYSTVVVGSVGVLVLELLGDRILGRDRAARWVNMGDGVATFRT